MHLAVKRFIKDVRKELPHKFRNRTVLEVGSHDINGSPRKYFWLCRYTGVDISKGKGVDIVGKITDFDTYIKLRPRYQIVVSTEMLEHDFYYKFSLKCMYDLLEDKGLLIITCGASPPGTRN